MMTGGIGLAVMPATLVNLDIPLAQQPQPLGVGSPISHCLLPW